MEIRIAEVDSDLEIVGSLLIQLRPSYDLLTIISQKPSENSNFHLIRLSSKWIMAT